VRADEKMPEKIYDGSDLQGVACREGPWLFSQSSVKCASGVALALCHYSDLLGERCHFGGLGQGFYTYREGTREGQRRLEASFGITMIENAACKLHDTGIAHVHDIAINALGGAKMEMARCQVSGSTHGVGLSQTANVKASASRFQGMDRGTFNPSECDNATLSLDGCTVQGRMWADEKQAKGFTSQVGTPWDCQFNPPPTTYNRAIEILSNNLSKSLLQIYSTARRA
jgi:hypothetical protein